LSRRPLGGIEDIEVAVCHVAMVATMRFPRATDPMRYPLICRRGAVYRRLSPYSLFGTSRCSGFGALWDWRRLGLAPFGIARC
jgi:hypothetical protein